MDSSFPDFSIITPSLNSGAFIEEMILSVLEQEGVSVEHIIQEAGSTDNTLEVLAKYPHLQVYQEKDSGLSDGINRGFKKAKGRYVMWLNADDKLLAHALLAVKDAFEKNPQADIVYGAWHFINKEGNILRTMKALPYDESMMIYYGCYIASTAFFLKRSSTLDKELFLDKDFRYVMDGEYYVRLGRAGCQFLNVNTPLASFRQHEGNISGLYPEKKDMEATLKRERLNAELAAIRKFYGKTFSSKENRQNIFLGFLFEAYRAKKALYTLTTPWVK